MWALGESRLEEVVGGENDIVVLFVGCAVVCDSSLGADISSGSS